MTITEQSIDLNVTPLSGHIGAVISGLDLRNLSDDEVAAIRQVWLEKKVVFFPEANLDPESHLEFAQRFGEFTEGHPIIPGIDGFPSVFEIDYSKARELYASYGDVSRRTQGLDWHTDVTFVERPPLGSILRAVHVRIGARVARDRGELRVERRRREGREVEGRALRRVVEAARGVLTEDARARALAVRDDLDASRAHRRRLEFQRLLASRVRVEAIEEVRARRGVRLAHDRDLVHVGAEPARDEDGLRAALRPVDRDQGLRTAVHRDRVIRGLRRGVIARGARRGGARGVRRDMTARDLELHVDAVHARKSRGDRGARPGDARRALRVVARGRGAPDDAGGCGARGRGVSFGGRRGAVCSGARHVAVCRVRVVRIVEPNDTCRAGDGGQERGRDHGPARRQAHGQGSSYDRSEGARVRG